MEYFLDLRINDYRILTFGWNILLALIPCLIVYWMTKSYQHKKWPGLGLWGQIVFLIVFLIWFFFFPNTVYLITDIRHLVDYCEEPGFLRVCKEQAYIVPIFFTYALIGIPTFYYALHQMAKVLRRLFNKTVGQIFPIIMIPIAVIGAMLGLVSRFNSWDIVRYPFVIIHTAFRYFGDTTMLLNMLSYVVMLYLIYYFIRGLRRRE